MNKVRRDPQPPPYFFKTFQAPPLSPAFSDRRRDDTNTPSAPCLLARRIVACSLLVLSKTLFTPENHSSFQYFAVLVADNCSIRFFSFPLADQVASHGPAD